MCLLHRFRLLVFVLSLFILTGCARGEARAWLKAPDWSHGVAIEETRIGDPVAMALDDEGMVYMLFVTAVNEQLSPKIVALNQQAERVWEKTLPVSLTQPDKPAIMWDGQVLHLFWLAGNSLYQTQMSQTGDLVAEPRLLSGEKVVDAFDVVLNPNGTLTVWYAGQRRDPGVFALLDGNLTGDAVLVDSEGVRPSLQYDNAGNLHASWAHYPPGYSDSYFFYAVYEAGVYEAGRETAVHEPLLKTTDIMTGPWLGLDKQQVYLVWNISVRTGPEAGKILTEYIYFPPGQPEQVSPPQSIAVPSVAELDYDYLPSTGMQAGERVLAINEYPRTTAVTESALIAASQSTQELVLAFDTMVQYEFRKERGQVGTLFLQDGAVNGYQLLSFTPDASVAPALLSDEAGHLYITWLERGELGGFQIYFASTNPDTIEALSGLTSGDMARISRDTGFGLLSGAALSPILVALWSLLPMIVVYLTSILRRGRTSKLVLVGTVLSLALATAAYWMVKLATIPGIRTYVPFSAWVPGIPVWLQAPLQIGVPILTTLTGIAVAWYFTYRRNSDSILNYILLFAAVDGLLTMAIYGFQFYNVI
jgi:hypothetical protein